MTRTLLTFALILTLTSCAVAPTPPATLPPATVDLSNAAALYLQASPTGGRSVLAPDGATLMKLLTSGEPGQATFLDSTGAEITVSVTRTHQLNADYLLAELDYGESPLTVLVTLASGELRTPPVPIDNWERVRVAGSQAYYVSGGAMHRVDLDALATVDMSQGDRISGNSLLFLDASSNVHTFNIVTGSVSPDNQVRVYYADDSPYSVLGWGSPDGVLFCENHIEDRSTGALYRIYTGAGGLLADRYVFEDDGIHIVFDQVLVDLPSAHDLVSSATGNAFLGNVLYCDETHAVSVSIDAAGAIEAVTVRTTTASMYGRPRAYDGDKLYVAYESGPVVALDMASGAEAELTTDTGITALEVVAGQVFYAKDSGTYKYDPVADTAELVSADPGEILAVTR